MQAPCHALNLNKQFGTPTSNENGRRTQKEVASQALTTHILQATESWVGLGNEAKTAVGVVL